MSTYNITFSHPVKGTAYLIDARNDVKYVIPAESDDDFVVKIPLQGLQKGKWIVNFEWEYNDRTYNCNGVVVLS